MNSIAERLQFAGRLMNTFGAIGESLLRCLDIDIRCCELSATGD